MSAELAESEPAWIETIAVVTECRFQFARMNTLTFGIGTGEKFRIRFNYTVQWAALCGRVPIAGCDCTE